MASPVALTVLIGAAGCGKSSWSAACGLPETAIVCLDRLRAEVSDDECDQAATADAVALMDHRLAARLGRRLSTVVDATNTEARVRRVLLDLAAYHRMPVDAVLFDVPLELLLERNAARPGPLPGRRWGRAVPAHIITTQHTAVRQLPAAPDQLRTEGFATVSTVGVPAGSPGGY